MDEDGIKRGAATPQVQETTTIEVPPDLQTFLPKITIRSTTDPSSEYLAGGGWPWLPGMLRSLPRYVDDVTRDLGTDQYWKMLESDPVLQSGVRLLVLAALAPGMRVMPAYANKIVGPGDKQYEIAARCAEHVELQFSRMGRSTHKLLEEMGVEALTTGHALAEQVFEPYLCEVSPDQGPQWALEDVRPKPAESYAMLVTPTNRFLGVQYSLPGQPVVTPTAVLPLENGTIPRFLPRRFLFHLPWHTKHDDPRGQSQLRSAYYFWWLKHQVLPDYRKWLATWAIPPIFGTVPKGSPPIKKADGSLITAEQAFLDVLLQLANGSAVVGQEGSTATPIQQQGSTSEGGPFTAAFGWCDRQMTQGVMYQIRTTIEAQFGSKADSGTAENLLDLLVGGLQVWMCEAPRQDIVRPLVAANYGATVAAAYCPLLTLARSTPANFPAEAHAISELKTSGVLTPDLVPEALARLGMSSTTKAGTRVEAENAADSQV